MLVFPPPLMTEVTAPVNTRPSTKIVLIPRYFASALSTAAYVDGPSLLMSISNWNPPPCWWT